MTAEPLGDMLAVTIVWAPFPNQRGDEKESKSNLRRLTSKSLTFLLQEVNPKNNKLPPADLMETRRATELARSSLESRHLLNISRHEWETLRRSVENVDKLKMSGITI